MKKSTKKKLKKLGRSLKKGYKKTSKLVKKYGPAVHRFSAGVAESSFNMLTPSRRERYLDLTQVKKPRRVVKGKGGFYLDYTD